MIENDGWLVAHWFIFGVAESFFSHITSVFCVFGAGWLVAQLVDSTWVLVATPHTWMDDGGTSKNIN